MKHSKTVGGGGSSRKGRRLVSDPGGKTKNLRDRDRGAVDGDGERLARVGGGGWGGKGFEAWTRRFDNRSLRVPIVSFNSLQRRLSFFDSKGGGVYLKVRHHYFGTATEKKKRGCDQGLGFHC